MFGIGGEHDLTERVLGHLSGLAATAHPCGSATVRGTSASSTCTASCSTPPTAFPSSSTGSARRPAASSPTWPTPPPRAGADTDQGIWETRGEPRHFVYSKLMCWVALDRAIALADRLDAVDRVERWKATRDEIADAIMTRGWNDEVGAFTQSFGSAELDASNLMMPIVGFIPAVAPADAGDDRRDRRRASATSTG